MANQNKKTCPFCQGGFVEIKVPVIIKLDGKHQAGYASAVQCDNCHGKGEVNTTGRERFDTAPTRRRQNKGYF